MAEKQTEAGFLVVPEKTSHKLIHRALLNAMQIGNRKRKSRPFLT